MRILVAPLNWGLGHASRCVPLIRRLQAEGHEVVLGGDGESLSLLRKHFPKLAVLPLAPLELRYSRGTSQVGAMLRALPRIIRSARLDHKMLADYLRYEQIDQIISDNRFGLYLSNHTAQQIVRAQREKKSQIKSIYITHQLTVVLPRPWQWLEPLVARWHRRIISRYDECWIPDNPASADLLQGLAGRLSHPAVLPPNAKYIGELSRFSQISNNQSQIAYPQIVSVLSGLEPQRTMLEQEIIRRYENSSQTVLIVRGKVQGPPTVVRHGNITIVPWLDDDHLAASLLSAERIICRSGYSSVMDMYALGVMHKVEWHPTPGQPEQEYLAAHIKKLKIKN